MDLETLLIAAAGRMRKLQSEVNVLNDIGENKKDKKVSSSAITGVPVHFFFFREHFQTC